jgi:hypothetical protein
MKEGGSRTGSRFPVGCLVRFVSDRGITPEGFRLTAERGLSVEEVPEGTMGVVVNPPSAVYPGSVMGKDIMCWVLVQGELLEVPFPHLRRV